AGHHERPDPRSRGSRRGHRRGRRQARPLPHRLTPTPSIERSPMKYLVHMDVKLRAGMPAEEAAGIKAKEKAYSQELQRSGKWPEIWRVVGEYANYSIFDVESNDELHGILQDLPL